MTKKWDRNIDAISKSTLLYFYVRKNKSMEDIAVTLGCSLHKVAYWMEKYKISRRTISEAIYQKRNPLGDPFKLREPENLKEAQLMGLGLGLYWGEGTKANKNSIRLGNTDPALVRIFIEFLKKFFGISQNKLRFGLQIFSDIKPTEALHFWMKELMVQESQFQKVIITPSRGVGTYRKKLQHGVLTVHFNNKKLREVIIGRLQELGYGAGKLT
jgi:hypothetical protein